MEGFVHMQPPGDEPQDDEDDDFVPPPPIRRDAPAPTAEQPRTQILSRRRGPSPASAPTAAAAMGEAETG